MKLLVLVALIFASAFCTKCTRPVCAQNSGNRCTKFVDEEVPCSVLKQLFSMMKKPNTLAYEYDNEEFLEDDEYTLSAEYTVDDYITDIQYTSGDCPSGYLKYRQDLNKGAKGEYIYICVKKGGNSNPLTDIQFFSLSYKPDFTLCSKGYKFIDYDLNKGSGGKFIYTCVTYGSGSPIVELSVQYGKDSYSTCPSSGFKSYSTVDLNSGAGGDFVYLCWKAFGKAVSKTIVKNMVYDLTALTTSQSSVKGVDQIVVTADKAESETSSVTGSYTTTQSRSWESSAGLEYGASVEMEVGIPMVAASTVTVSATTTFSYTIGESTETSETRGYTVQCKAEAWTKKTCAAVYRLSTVNVPYTATKVTVYMDGTNESKEISGMFNGVAAGQLEIMETVEEIPKKTTSKSTKSTTTTSKKKK